MSTVSSTGITDLMQMFSTSATPAVSSLLSSSKVQTALEKAPVADIVQLSDQATRLQEVDGLFGQVATAPQSSGMAEQDLLTSIYSGSNLDLLA